MDDELTIRTNQSIRGFSPWSRVLYPERELPTAGRPLVNISFALNYAFGGLDLRGYHVANVAIHVLCALVLFGVVRRSLTFGELGSRFGSRSADIALAASLIWVLHPLNTEAVNYLTQRTESMMALFYLLTLYTSIRGRESPRGFWETLAIVSCALGMACKESMVTAPLMVVLYDRVFTFDSFRETFRSRWRLYLALAATWIVVVVFTWSGPRVHSAGFGVGVHPWIYLLNQTLMIQQYFRLVFWPRSLVLNYGPPIAVQLGDVLPQTAFILGLFALTVWALVKRPSLGFLGAWFFITLAPSSSIVPIATEVGAERRMYLPLAALVVLAVVVAVVGWERFAWGPRHGSSVEGTSDGRAAWGPRASLLMGSTLALVAGLLGIGTVLRNREYGSSLRIAETVLERHPTAVAQHMVGEELLKVGRTEEGKAHLREAIKGAPKAHYTLGEQLYRDGQFDEAIQQLEEFARKQPMLLEVPYARVTIGRARLQQQKPDQAAEQFRLALKMIPSLYDAQHLLGKALFARERYDDAIVHYREFLKRYPNDTSALTSSAVALAATGQIDEAATVFGRVVELNPQSGDAHRNLGNVLLEKQDFAGAAAEARQALALNASDGIAHDILGLALFSQRQVDEAIEHFRQAAQLNPERADIQEHLIGALKVRDALRRQAQGAK